MANSKGSSAGGSGAKTHYEGRSSVTGKFTTVPYARSHPNSTQVERVPNPGYGDTKKK